MADQLKRLDTDETLTIQRLVGQELSNNTDTEFIRFEGRKLPVAFKGEGEERQWQFQATYGRQERSDAVALLDYLRRAYNAADGRLEVTLEGPAGSNATIVNVAVSQWSEQRKAGGQTTIPFRAQEVFV